MKKKYILSAFAVLWLLLCSSFISVKAAVIDYTPQSYYFFGKYDETYFKSALSYLWKNETFKTSYSPENTVIFIFDYSEPGYTDPSAHIIAVRNDLCFTVGENDGNVFFLNNDYSYTYYEYPYGSESMLETADFSDKFYFVQPHHQFYWLPAIYINGSDSLILEIGAGDVMSDGSYGFFSYPTMYKCSYVFDYGAVKPFNPITDPLLIVPYNQGIQTQGFAEWLVSTEKYTTIPVELGKSQVKAFVDYFNQYGSSLLSFIANFPKFATQMSILSPSNNVLQNTKTIVDNLYQEYLNEKNDTVLAHQNDFRESHMEITPETSDDNKTLVTSDPSDDTNTSILRDILRSVVALPNFIIDSTSAILNKLDALITAVVNSASDDSSIFVSDSEINAYVDSQMNDLLNSQAALSGIDSEISSSPYYLADTSKMQETDNVSLSFPSVSNITLGSDYSLSIEQSTFEFDMSQYPVFDSAFKLFRKFAAVLIVFGFLVSLRYDLPNIIKGEGEGQ